MIFGVLRSCYQAPARFTVGGPVDTIRWYYAPEGAAIYTAPNIFFPLSQTMQYKPTDGVGELHGGGFPYRNGTPRPEWDGLTPHGTEDDFLGKRVWVAPTPWQHVPACAAPCVIEFGGGVVEPEPEPALEFGGESTYIPPGPCFPFCDPEEFGGGVQFTLSCPAIPDLDGYTFTPSFFSSSDVCYFVHFPSLDHYPPFYFYLQMTRDSYPQMLWHFIAFLDSFHYWDSLDNLTNDWLCDPLVIAGEGDLTPHVIVAEHSTISFSAHAAPGGGSTPLGCIEFGGGIVTRTPTIGGVEFGGESSVVTPNVLAEGTMEFGGEILDAHGVHVLAGGVELGGVSNHVHQLIGGCEFGGESLLHFDLRGGIEFGGEATPAP